MQSLSHRKVCMLINSNYIFLPISFNTWCLTYNQAIEHKQLLLGYVIMIWCYCILHLIVVGIRKTEFYHVFRHRMNVFILLNVGSISTAY